MNKHLLELFTDKLLVDRIQKRLPKLFRIAELESSRAGKIGMQVGSLRESVIVALLIYKFGEENINTDFPIVEPEIDAEVFGQPVSIKTITGRTFSGVKLIWTVDASKAREFLASYYPRYDILLVQIDWDRKGGFYYITREAQQKVFEDFGREKYIKLPKPGTNPRGAEISKEALLSLVQDKEAKVIEISWQKQETDYRPYQRWIDYWSENE